MRPWFRGEGYNRKKGYEYIWAIYRNTTIGTVYTELESRKDIHTNGNEEFMPLVVKQIGKHIVVIQQVKEAIPT